MSRPTTRSVRKRAAREPAQPPAPPARRAAYALGGIARDAERARDLVAKFAAALAAPRVDNDLAHHLEWSDDAIAAAGFLKAFADVDAYLTRPAAPTTTVGDLRRYLTRQVADGARNPSRSSSAMRNVVDQATLAARATILEKLEYVPDDVTWGDVINEELETLMF
jgi:hypothetical protein